MAKRKKHRIENSIEEKHCSKCDQWLPLSEFSKVTRNWDHLHSNCRSCYYKYMKSSKGVSNYRRRYLKDNKKKLSKKNIIYKQSLRGKYAEYRSMAKRREYEFNLSMDEFSAMWQKPCSYCGDSIDTIGIDRVDNSIGYTAENTEPCCKQCNVAKNNMSRSDFLDLVKRIYLQNN